MTRVLCAVQVLLVLLTGIGFGAIHPSLDSAYTQNGFPLLPADSDSISLVAGQAVIQPSVSIQTAKNEHHLFIVKVSNLDMSNTVAVRLLAPDRTAPAWLRADAFQLLPVPQDLSNEFFADGLIPLDSGLTVQMDPVYLAVRITTTEAHPSGIHHYTLCISEGAKALYVPLRLDVLPFALPRDLDPIIEANSGYTVAGFTNADGIDVFPSYLAALREYRINAVASIYSFNVNSLVAGKAIEDYDKLTQRLDNLFDPGSNPFFGFKYFRLPNLTKPYDAQTVGCLGEYNPRESCAGEDLFSGVANEFYSKWHNYMSGKGWEDKALVKLWDEPSPEEIPPMITAYGIVKNVFPFKTEVTGRAPSAEMAGKIDTFINHFQLYDPSVVKPLRDRIDNALYANMRHWIKAPPSHQRAVGSYLYRNNASGYLLWGIISNGAGIEGDTIDPWTTAPSVDGDFRSGAFFYQHPTKKTPIPTLRLEALRRGFEDYLYMDLLKKNRDSVPTVVWDLIHARIAQVTADWQSDVAEVTSTWEDFESIRIWIGGILGQSISGGHRAALWENQRPVDLGTLGGMDSWANALNNQDPPTVVGASTGGGSQGFTHAFAWRNNVMTDLGTLDGDQWSTATGVDDSGRVVGVSASEISAGLPRTRACLWVPDGDGRYTVAELVPPDGKNRHASAINNSGQVVGEVQEEDGRFHAFLYDIEQGVERDLGDFSPTGINDGGVVVGATANGVAVQWENGVIMPVGSPGDAAGFPGERYVSMSAAAIGQSGWIVGGARGETAEGLPFNRAIRWEGEREETVFASPEKSDSYAQAINASNAIAGYMAARYPARDYSAFLWQEGQLTRDLGPGAAFALNDRGLAAGFLGPPTGTVNINRTGSPYAVDLVLSAKTGGLLMSFSDTPDVESSWSDWEPFAQTKPWTLTPGEGVKTVGVQFQDPSTGLISNVITASIIVDLIPPVGYTITGDSPTRTALVGITTVKPEYDQETSGLASLLLSNTCAEDSCFTEPEAPWEWNGPVWWDLNKGVGNPDEDGPRTVFAKFKDRAGNISTLTQAQWLLDRKSPLGKIGLNIGTPYTEYTKDQVVSVTLTEGEDFGGSGITRVLLSNDTAENKRWTDLPLPCSWDIGGIQGLHTVYSKLVDAAGNVSNETQSTLITLDTSRPTSIPDQLPILINNGESITNSESVVLTLAARDVYSGVDQMRFSNDGTTWSDPEPYGVSKSWTLSEGDEFKTVFVKFIDKAGNESSVFSDRIKLDKTPQAIVVGRPSLSLTQNGPITYTVTYTGAASVSLATADVTLAQTGTATGNVGVTGSGNTTRTVTISGITEDGTIGISIAGGTAKDSAGNEAPAAEGQAFIVDNTAPGISISAPSVSLARRGPVKYTITYDGASSVNLTPDMVTTTGTAVAGSVLITGIGAASRTISLSEITGDGTLGISINSGSAVDSAGNSSPEAGPSETFTVDNTRPSVILSTTAPDPTRTSPIPVTITFNEVVADFTNAGITVTNGSIGILSGSGKVYA
ncbi:MAG: glycoside hydrolase domain-containing protein, partial [Syntrophobacteraceae bacterium]